MARKFKELFDRMPAEDRAEVKAWVAQEIEKMPLRALRSARHQTQTEMAELLEMNQGNISKLEQREDMYLSTLRNYVEAMGGKLEIRAVFPDRKVEIDLADKLSA
jgi:DNA-binding XRE family transcriptional regulator